MPNIYNTLEHEISHIPREIGTTFEKMIKESYVSPVSSPISDAISKDMKKRGFKFFGTTIC